MKKSFISFVVLMYFCTSLAGSLPTIAILDLEAVGCDSSIAIAASEILRTEIINTNEFRVIERGQLYKLIEEHSLHISGLVDVATVAEIGAIIGVEYIGIGSISRIGDTYTISIRVIDVETAEATLGKTVTINELDELASMCQEIAWELSDKDKPKTEGEVSITTIPTGVAVFVDGDLAGMTPLELTLKPGEYSFRFSKSGFYEETQRIVIIPGENQPIKISMSSMSPRYTQQTQKSSDSGFIWVVLGIAALVGIALLLGATAEAETY